METNGNPNHLVAYILQNIFIHDPQKKESHTGLGNEYKRRYFEEFWDVGK